MSVVLFSYSAPLPSQVHFAMKTRDFQTGNVRTIRSFIANTESGEFTVDLAEGTWEIQPLNPVQPAQIIQVPEARGETGTALHPYNALYLLMPAQGNPAESSWYVIAEDLDRRLAALEKPADTDV